MRANHRWEGGAPGDDSFDPEKFGIQGGHNINWYPGHIAKAERELKEYLKLVDVVIEVRDARIPEATTHQLVPEWVGNRPMVVAFSRVDMTPSLAVDQWKKYLSEERGMKEAGRKGNVPVFFVDAKRGKGVHQIKRAAIRAGARVNERRVARGMNPRSVRAAVIGFPNVGKSALINQLIGKKVAQSRNIPGVTRKIRWIRLGGTNTKVEQELELLDSPGIIPAKHDDQHQALMLAICNTIGQASYDNQVVAARAVDQLVESAVTYPGYVDLEALKERYGIDPRRHTGEEYLFLVAKKLYHGEMNAAADKLLGDLRRGNFGRLALEAPPSFNAFHNRLVRAEDNADGHRRGAGGRRDGGGRGGGGGGRGEDVVDGAQIGAAAKAEREFVGQGDFEGW